MSHVTDDLELHVLGALPPAQAARVEAHLAGCAACASDAAALEAVVSALQEALPAQDPPAALRERILASARTQRTGPVVAFRPRRAWLPASALAAAAVVLAVLGAGVLRQMDALRAERDASVAIAQRVSQGGRSWYMGGVDRWATAGGMLFVPPRSPAYVVFRDLPAAPPGASYTIWLVDAEGRWVRGSSFAPSEPASVLMVDVGVPVDGFDRCAVTLETQPTGKRAGPIVMQSRMY